MDLDKTTFIAANAIVELEPVFQAFVVPNSRIPENFTFVQLRTLYLLQHFGRLTISEIADHHCVTMQHMSQTIPIMEKMGLVERSKDAGNKKNVYVSITDSGLAFLNEYSLMAAEHFGELLAGISEEEKEEITVCCDRLKNVISRVLERSHPLYLKKKNRK